jgi:hypothetical protein
LHQAYFICFWFVNLHQKAGAYVEHTKCPRGRFAVVARTVRACAESVRVPSFSQDLLAKTAGLAWETTCSATMKGYGRLNTPQSIKSSLFLVFTLCIRSSSSLAFFYLKSSPLFGSTSTRCVLGGPPTPRHTLQSVFPDGVPLERRDLGLL